MRRFTITAPDFDEPGEGIVFSTGRMVIHWPEPPSLDAWVSVEEFRKQRPDHAITWIDPDTTGETDWRCPRCGSPKWVAASLTGPVAFGGRAIKQCAPCGHYSNDPTEGDTP